MVRPGARFERITGQNLPMVEDALWESLSTGVGSEIGGKAERFVDRKIGFYDEHGRAGNLLFLEYVTTATIEYSVDSTDGNLGTLDLAEIDRLHETWRSGQKTRVQTTSRCWNNLTATSVNRVSVQRYVVNVETYASQVLFREHTLKSPKNFVLIFHSKLLGKTENEKNK